MASTEISSRLLERGAELAALRDLAAGAAAGRGGCALLEGPAGIGKSSLLAAAVELGVELGLEPLTARGGELERDFAYGVVRQLLEPRLMRTEPAEREALFEGAAALAAPLLGLRLARAGEAEGALSGDPGLAAMHGLYWLTANLTAETPLLMVVDDLHWADTASVRFLAYLARRAGELSLLLVAGSRPPVESPAPELIEALAADPSVRRLEPAELSGPGVADVVRGELGPDAADEFCVACHASTRGNPFLLHSLLDAVSREGVPAAAQQVPRLPDIGGPALARSVSRRLSGLGGEAEALARAVAVLGTNAEPRLARMLAELDDVAARQAADALRAAEVLAEGTPLEFVHPLVRAAVHDGIPSAERAARHLEAARLLHADDADAERVAPHLLAAERRGDPWVVEALRAAAARSVDRGAPETAVRFLRRALEEPPEARARPPLLAELGRAELRAALPDAAVDHLRAARAATEDARERALMAHDLAVGLIAPGRYLEAVEMLEEAAADAAGTDPELARRVQAELVCAARLEPATIERGRAWLARLPADIAGDTPGERLLLGTLAHQRVLDGNAAEAADLAGRAVDGGLAAEQPCDSGLVLDAAFALVLAGDFGRAERLFEQAFADVRRRGSVIGFARISVMRAIMHVERGALKEAESDARNAIEAAWEPGYRIARMAYGPLVSALVDQGQLDAADQALSASGFAQELPDSFMLNFVLYARARLRAAQGRHADALADLEELGARESRWRDGNPGVFARRSLTALALLAGGDRRRALAAAREELELARRWGTPGAVGRSQRTLGLVAGGQEGLTLLHESLATLDGSGWRLEHAHTLVALGAALRRAGRRADAREPLHAGMELAHRCDAAALVEGAREELVATGARPRRIMRTGVHALTASERRVARMAAEGMTNREIAQALFVTSRTVEVHLTHAYQKLGIGSRQELPEALSAA